MWSGFRCCFFEVNEITDGCKKKSVFLSLIEASTYKVLRDLVSPEGEARKQDLR